MSTRVKDICKEKGVTLSFIAEQIGTTQTSLSRALGEKGNPTLETLHKVASALNVPIADLFEQPDTSVMTCPKCGAKLDVKERE